ncbi:MAG: hypothetical protein HC836_22725 [Richelia sp. RM2_1_2]|nr:hypothetical protein [Richelia sp. RM2_1_2]
MFNNYYFVPLDVPKLLYNRSALLTFFDNNKYRVDDPVSKPLDDPWNIVWLWRRGSNNFESFVETLFPNLIEIFNCLPHYYINNVALLEQVIEVKPHCDVSKENSIDLGPSSYRCMLINDEPNSTFYFKEGVRWQGNLRDTEIFPTMPCDTNFFAINNHITMHGSHTLTKSTSRKIMLTVWGNVDITKHIALLDKSIKKYKEYCLQCNLNQNPQLVTTPIL